MIAQNVWFPLPLHCSNESSLEIDLHLVTIPAHIVIIIQTMHPIVRLVESNCAQNCLVCFLQLITPPIPVWGEVSLSIILSTPPMLCMPACMEIQPVLQECPLFCLDWIVKFQAPLAPSPSPLWINCHPSWALLNWIVKISSTFGTITISSVDQSPSIMSSCWTSAPKQLCLFCFRTCELHKTLRFLLLMETRQILLQENKPWGRRNVKETSEGFISVAFLFS